MKRPSFQFYPADWRKDPALSACSLAARGLWIELMCIAHEGDNYGHLSINGKPMTTQQVARMVGESPTTVVKLMTELEDANVFSRGEDGSIYSRRMVKDERIRNVRADAGRLGGNPNLLKQKDKQIKKQEVEQTAEQNITPSSSTSVISTSLRSVEMRASRLPADWSLPDEWRAWALTERPDLNPERTAASFADYWRGKAGKDGRKADWLATWRNWVRNERTQAQRRQPSEPKYAAAARSIFGVTTPQQEIVDVTPS